MAQVKMTFKTPELPLSWVNIQGQGKLKMNAEDNGEAKNYNYTATVTYPDEKAMLVDKKKFDTFWRENKGPKLTKQNYDMFKPEMEPDLDADGQEQKDEDGAIIKKPTGKWTLAAKTITHWPKDGKANVVKVLRGSGKPLNLGERLIGTGSTGVIHGSVGINAFPGNEGLAFYLSAVQLSKFVEYVGNDEIEADELAEEGMEDLDMDEAEQGENPAGV